MWSSVEMFFEYSANFLIKDKNMDQDVLHKLVWKRVDRELENIEVWLSKKKKERSNPSSKWASCGHCLIDLWERDKYYCRILRKHDSLRLRLCSAGEKPWLDKARTWFVLCALPPSPTFTRINSVIVSSSHFLPRYAFNVSNLPSSQKNATRSNKFFSNSK